MNTTRTLDQVEATLRRDEARGGVDLACGIARLLVKHGNITEPARLCANKYLAAHKQPNGE
jgi:hypothetical protein